jgi:hypothetical protein
MLETKARARMSVLKTGTMVASAPGAAAFGGAAVWPASSWFAPAAARRASALAARLHSGAFNTIRLHSQEERREEGLLHAAVFFFLWARTRAAAEARKGREDFQDVQPRWVMVSLQTRLLDSNKHEFEAEGGRERRRARGDRLGNHRDGFDAVT